MATTATSLRILLLEVVNELQDLRAGRLRLGWRRKEHKRSDILHQCVGDRDSAIQRRLR